MIVRLTVPANTSTPEVRSQLAAKGFNLHEHIDADREPDGTMHYWQVVQQQEPPKLVDGKVVPSEPMPSWAKPRYRLTGKSYRCYAPSTASGLCHVYAYRFDYALGGEHVGEGPVYTTICAFVIEARAYELEWRA